METFNTKSSWIAMGRHELRSHVFRSRPSADTDKIALAKKLNDRDLYQVTLGGKTRTVTFEQMARLPCAVLLRAG